MSERPLRVLVLLGGIPLLGQERGNIEAIDALVKETGAECLFVTHRTWGHLHLQPELDRRGLPWTTAPYAGRFEKGMPLGRWLTNIITILRANLALCSLLWRFRPTHVHVCNPGYFLNFLPMLLLTRLPIVYRLGDAPPRGHRLLQHLWRLIVFRATSFVCISRFVQSKLEGRHSGSLNCHVIYNRPPTRTRLRSASVIHEKLGTRFLYVGQLTADKGLAELVEAALSLCRAEPDARFLVAGDYSWQNPFAKGLMARVYEAGLAERIRFLGYVDDVPGLLAASDVHVCPSLREEPLGNVVMEAKQARRPSIVFPSGGLPELMIHGVDGYVCRAKTADALEAAFRYYLDNPEIARKQGEAAQASLERLGVPGFARRWREVYDGCARRPLRDVVGSARGRPPSSGWTARRTPDAEPDP